MSHHFYFKGCRSPRKSMREPKKRYPVSRYLSLYQNLLLCVSVHTLPRFLLRWRKQEVLIETFSRSLAATSQNPFRKTNATLKRDENAYKKHPLPEGFPANQCSFRTRQPHHQSISFFIGQGSFLNDWKIEMFDDMPIDCLLRVWRWPLQEPNFAPRCANLIQNLTKTMVFWVCLYPYVTWNAYKSLQKGGPSAITQEFELLLFLV